MSGLAVEQQLVRRKDSGSVIYQRQLFVEKEREIKTLLDCVLARPRLNAHYLTVVNRSRSEKVVDVFESLMQRLH
jgi:hypothetical protein